MPNDPDQSRRWPGRSDYHQIVSNPRQWVRNSKIKRLSVQTRPNSSEPWLRSGNFGGVYKFVGPQSFALKVFTRSEPDRNLRYRLISERLRKPGGCASLVTFEYDPEGIFCAGAWWPTLVMDWADGQRLDLYLAKAFESAPRVDNGALCRRWIAVVDELSRNEIAHGDLQQGNILVLNDGSFKLVDYDGMFVPAMKGRQLPAAEAGLPAYQHPKRAKNPGYFNERLDRFSALAVLLTLASINRDLWTRYNRGDDQCLIFRHRDFLSPSQSDLFKELAQSPDEVIRKLSAVLNAAALSGIDKVPSLSAVLGDVTIAGMLAPSWSPAEGKVGTRKAPAPAPRCKACTAPLAKGDRYCRKCAAPVHARAKPRPVLPPNPDPPPRPPVRPLPTPSLPAPPPAKGPAELGWSGLLFLLAGALGFGYLAYQKYGPRWLGDAPQKQMQTAPSIVESKATVRCEVGLDGRLVPPAIPLGSTERPRCAGAGRQ